jgi:DNA gyrase subunit A
MDLKKAGIQGTKETDLRLELEKRYLAYALSTIVSRALPDVRDGLKPVHRRILYAMHAMKLSDTAKMRKSAAVVGEVIGKYHPHGDQAAYDALVRMAQDFSLRYPLIDGSGNFGSLDGDSPAAMRYTETRPSRYAALLLREIDEGTTAFRPTYDAMGEEPLILPAAVPNLLLNGSSGIAVGMSCSFPPHNLYEVVAACRAMIREPGLGVSDLLSYIKGPDFPTGGEVLDNENGLAEIYRTGHGSIRHRGTFQVEKQHRGRTNIVLTSIPYSVNKSRLIERIANLIRDKKLRQVIDVRDESAQDVRVVLELKGPDVNPETVMAFLYKHTELHINFPANFIAITKEGVPERLSLSQLLKHFLDFRHETVVLRLRYRLDILLKRIRLLEGFEIIFDDLDLALRLIREAKSRQEAFDKLKEAFPLDKEQTDAILELRLYKLVGLEMGKVLEELSTKRREAADITKDLSSADRIWRIIDKELADIAIQFGDQRHTNIIEQITAPALDFDPDELADHEDATVILSQQGWIRRMKSRIEDSASLKFREGDGLLGFVRVNTGSTVAVFTSVGKVYVIRAGNVPATGGFGEPIGNLISLADGESAVALLTPDPQALCGDAGEQTGRGDHSQDEWSHQPNLFDEENRVIEMQPQLEGEYPSRGIVVTRQGKGFRFEYEHLSEPSKRMGRRLATLKPGDQVFSVFPEQGPLLAVAADSGHVVTFGVDQVPVVTGAAQGVQLIKLKKDASVIAALSVKDGDYVRINTGNSGYQDLPAAELPMLNRAARGRKMAPEIKAMEILAGKIDVLSH